MGFLATALKVVSETVALRHEDKRKELALKAATKLLNSRRHKTIALGHQTLLGLKTK